MKFAIGIPTINRVDLLKECLEDLAENLSDVEQIYITDNGNQNIIAIIPDKIRNITRLYTPGKNLGCSGSWNDMMRRAFTSKKISVDYLLILNDDIIFGHTTTDLKAAVEKHPDALIINSGGWSCFMVSKECYELVGPFDEKFYPAYFEDNDYAYRISLLERPNAIVKARPEFKPKVFRSSMSLKKDPTLNKTFGENKKYYERKWGGLPCHEKYKTPFNRPKEVSINEIKVL